MPDDAFACKALGEGIAIEPTEEYVKAPDDGQVTMIFDTKHALGFLTSTGVYLLIHIGIDTVKLGGKGFEALVNTGDKVKRGTPLIKLDLEYIKENAPSTVTPIVCSELLDSEEVELVASGEIKVGEKLFSVCRYSK